MIKATHIVATILLAIFIYACGNDDNTNTAIPFDHVAQALIDDDSLVSFLEKHYYDEIDSVVKPLITGKTALINDNRLVTQNITENIAGDEVNFNLYTLVVEKGDDPKGKGNPTAMDSIFTRYSGQVIINSDSINSNIFDQATMWWMLSGRIRGWGYGYTNFTGGENISAQNNEPINFKGGGKGVLFIPSGLAYGDSGRGNSIPRNAILLFYINLFDFIPDTDADNDGIPSIKEDPDGDGNPRNDDTDGNRVVNFLDPDDDGDGKPTRDEDTNGNGDPTDDFNDPNNPNIPDYLNPFFFGG